MKILVTGATGFIGAHLCHRLVKEGHGVLALVRDRKKAAALPTAGVELLEGDLGLFARSDLVLPPCDAVVHLAGVVTARRPSDYDAINHQAVEHLVACLLRQSWRPRRLLFASSLAAAGPSTDGAAKTEADPCTPTDPYGKSKLAAERFLATVPFPVTSFRPAMVFGEGDTATLTLFRAAQRGVGFRVAGAPRALSFIDLDDLLDAVMAMLGDVSTGHRTFFVSHPQPTDHGALWAALGTALQRRVVAVPIPPPVLFGAMLLMTGLAKLTGFQNQLDRKQYQQLMAPGFVCSSAALQRELHWRPQFDLQASLARAVQGYRRAGWL